MLLPLMRLIKGYSVLLNAFGREGPVPDALTASRALLFSQFNAEHGAIMELYKERVLPLAAEFEEQSGYGPPYWELLELVRSVKESTQDSLPHC